MSGVLGNKKIMASNIRRHLDERGLNVKDFAKLLNFKYSTVLDWVNAKTYPRIDKIEIMSNYFGVEKSDLVEVHNPFTTPSTPQDITNPVSDEVIKLDKELGPPRHGQWVEYGERLLKEQLDEQKKESSKIQKVPAEYNSDKIIAFPPKYNYDFYDNAGSAGTGQYLGDVRKEVIALPVDVDADFVIPVYGRSMEPEYYTDDYVFVKLSVDLKDGDIGVFDYYGDAYIKQLVIDEDGAYLHSFNPEYPDMPIDADSDFRIIGEVVDVYREST